MFTRQVTWGDALLLEIKKSRGGLKAAHDSIVKLSGSHLGTRNTYAKLCEVRSPEDMDEQEALRAWLLLVALGLEPGDWNVPDTAVPNFMVKPDLLRRRLRKFRASRLGESNPRPIHYKWVRLRQNRQLSQAS